uniref:Protein PET100 homolog, mitochondrial n=1 Tax=Plectus sambesii TaxID=2011161 RepID=A0A914UVN0_9BILA
MGNWKLESFKFAFYVAFPVGIFYYFNKPEVYDYFVNRLKREQPEMIAAAKTQEEFRQLKEEFLVAQRLKNRAALEEAKRDLLSQRQQSST